MFEQKGLGNEGTDAARLKQLGQDGDQVDNKNGHRAGISVEVGELK